MTAVVFQGAEIHYDLHDRRLPWAAHDEAIVFHHGVGACADTWAGWSARLGDNHRMLGVDMRGHGRSAVPEGYPWTIDALVADLAAVVDHAGLERFHLVGESIGGTIVLAFAARYPERIRTLTVSNGAHRGAPIRNLSPWPGILADGGMEAWSNHMMEMRFFERSINPAEWQWYRDQQARGEGDTVLALADALSATDLTPELGAVTMPTLLLHPDSSPFIPVALMAELHDALPNSRLEVFAHTRHGLPFSHAAQCSRVLADFIADRRRDRA